MQHLSLRTGHHRRTSRPTAEPWPSSRVVFLECHGIYKISLTRFLLLVYRVNHIALLPLLLSFAMDYGYFGSSPQPLQYVPVPGKQANSYTPQAEAQQDHLVSRTQLFNSPNIHPWTAVLTSGTGHIQ